MLLAALWPLRYGSGELFAPAKCSWTSLYTFDQKQVNPDWVVTVGMLLFAYLWKLSQLFVSSRGLVRRWLVAKPEAAIERLLRRAVRSHRPRWLTWPISKMLTICLITFVAYAEFAESFIATIIYLCLALAYGLVLVVTQRGASLSDDVIAGERRLTFGQLVPLLLLILPILLIFELSAGGCDSLLIHHSMLRADFLPESEEKPKTPNAIYSLVRDGLHLPKNPSYRDLTCVLLVNKPSKSEDKMQNDQPTSCDPVIDHLISSRAFSGVIWSFFVVLVGVGLTIVALSSGSENGDDSVRWFILTYGGLPGVALAVPLTALFSLPFSRRLR